MKTHFPGSWVMVVTATDQSLDYAAHHRLLRLLPFKCESNIFGYECTHTRLYLYKSNLQSSLWSIPHVYNHAFVWSPYLEYTLEYKACSISHSPLLALLKQAVLSRTGSHDKNWVTTGTKSCQKLLEYTDSSPGEVHRILMANFLHYNR